MSIAFADALKTAGFFEEVSLDAPSGLSLTVYRSLHDLRVLLHVDTPRIGGRSVIYVIADDAPAPATIAGATALLAVPAPENCFPTIDELAVELTRRDRLKRRAAARADQTAGVAS